MKSESVILQALYYFIWITDCYRIGWNITSDHRSCSNGHVVANGDRLCPFLTGFLIAESY